MNFIKRLCAVFCTIFALAGIFFTVYGTVNKGESFTFAYNIGKVEARGINVNLKTHKIKSVGMSVSGLQFETPPETPENTRGSNSKTPDFTADGVIFEGENVTALSFNFDTVAVKVVSGDELKIETANNELEYRVSDGVLYLNADLSVNDSQITLTLPKNAAFEWVEIETDMGSFKSEAEIKTKKLVVTNNAGAVEMNNLTVTESLNAQNDLGSIELSGVIQSEIKLTSDLGAVSCEIFGSENDYGYNINSSLGRVKIGSAKAVTNGSAKSGGDKQSVITAECDLGNITVTFKN